MYDKILVPLDGSKLAEQVLPYVQVLARAQKLPVVLVQSYNPIPIEVFDALGEQPPLPVDAQGTASSGGRGSYLAEVSEARRLSAAHYLEGIRQAFAEAGIPATAVVRDIVAEEAIAEEGGEGQRTLIVIATHGRSGITRWVLGSVLDRVLQSTSNPLLVVRPREDAPARVEARFRNIILPVDGSPVAEQVLPFAIALAKALDLTVRPVRVLPQLAAYYGNFAGYSDTAYQGFIEDAERAVSEYLHELKGRLRQEGLTKVETAVLAGSPANAIVDLARDIPDGLVAITTHGRSGVGRWVLGSVADRVVRGSRAPVLLIRAQEDETRSS